MPRLRPFFVPLKANLVHLFRLSGVLALLAVALFTLSPPEWRPHTGLPGLTEHFSAALIVGFLLTVGFDRCFVGTALAVLAVVAFLETAQIFIPGRHANLTHLEVKLAGAALGLMIGWSVRKLSGSRGGNQI